MQPITKPNLRTTLLAYRRLLDTEIFKERNIRVCEKLQSVVREKDLKIIHTFLPITRNREPDISLIFSDLRELGCQLVGSKTDFSSKSMQHFYLNENTELRVNRMGIPEPVDAKPIDIEKVDLILVPLSAADSRGNRIGYGGGYYDRLLMESKALKIGLCLSPLLDEISQIEDWDVKLDKVITPFSS